MAQPKSNADAFFSSATDALKDLDLDRASSMSEKIEVLKRYPLIFRDIDVTLTNILPILMQRKETHILMERIYDRQHELILKRKSLDVLNLPEVICKMIAEQNNQTRNHFIQSISNLVYSMEKYCPKFPEFAIFLKFCQAGFVPQHLLFFMFIRQHFKILTYTNFMAHKKTGIDPAAIQLSKENGNEILRTAFSHDNVTHGLLREGFNTLFKDKSKATYYQFIVALNNVKVNYKDLVLMDKLIALYSIDYEEQLRRHFETKSPKPQKGKMGNTVNAVQRDSIDKELFNSGKTPEHLVNAAEEADDGDAMEINETDPRLINSLGKGGKAPGGPRGFVLARKGLEGFYNAVKAAIQPFIQNLLMSFPASKALNFNQLQENSNVIGLLIENKLNALVDSLFAEDPKKFAKLLRDEHGLNPDILAFWDKQIENIHREGLQDNFTEQDASDILARMYDFPLINTHVKFLIGYRFKSEKELSELKAQEMQLLQRV